MDVFFYWSGVAMWLVLASITLLLGADEAINWIIKSFWTKREFMAFVLNRLQKRKERDNQ